MDHDLFEKCTALRHEIHMYPDLSNEERPTLERILAFLKKNTNNIEIHDAGHYVWCAYRSPDPKKPNMGFRGDCDALPMEDLIDQPWRSRIPGKAHTCGHDGHTAALAGLILSLDRYGADRDVFCVFQPAEENGTGAIACMDFITDNHVQQFFSVHGRGKSYPFSIATRKGTLQCASKGMTVTMTGIPAHAGNPEDGKNPSMALCALAEYSRTVLQDPKFTKFVLVTIIHLGIGKENAFGISAGTGKLQMTIRAEDEAELEELQAMLETKAKELAETDGLQAAFTYQDEFPMVYNDEASVEKVKKAAAACGYPFYEVPVPRRGSEDVGHFLKAAPGCFFYCSFGYDHPANHTSEYEFDDEGVERTANVYMALVAGE
ncbi:MAG: amidohydrolase [Firmicutes bacterium]|nr:amidohydrolase [Bacillota bacterium]